ncbi:MAG: hypothetical protein ACJZ1S_00335 [Candidatus Neomarinimicrobiota bacterium]
MRFIIISLLSFTLFGCLISEPELEWEDVTSNHDPVLNVFGLLSADSILTSFVKVHRTLNMEEAADSLTRDTIGGNIFISYVSRFIIRDAEVIVSNGENEYKFEYSDYSFGLNGSLSESYQYQGNDLYPQPGETWVLNVTTPEGLSVTGETIIPPLPQIFSEELPDSFQLDQTMEITWQPMIDNYQIMNIGNYLGYFGYDEYYGGGFSCGLWQENIIKPEEESWTYRRDICDVSNNEEWDEDLLLLNLMSMDNNYFDYFIRFGEVEFSSSTVGEGGSGRSFGINNGIGIFGSVAIDRHWIPMIP